MLLRPLLLTKLCALPFQQRLSHRLDHLYIPLCHIHILCVNQANLIFCLSQPRLIIICLRYYWYMLKSTYILNTFLCIRDVRYGEWLRKWNLASLHLKMNFRLAPFPLCPYNADQVFLLNMLYIVIRIALSGSFLYFYPSLTCCAKCDVGDCWNMHFIIKYYLYHQRYTPSSINAKYQVDARAIE